MKKCGLFTLLLLFLLLPFCKTSEAKLNIISPQQMIALSSHIVIGTVTKKEYTEELRQVEISVGDDFKCLPIVTVSEIAVASVSFFYDLAG